MPFVQPRRFSECFQALVDYPGTMEQQTAVREAFHLEYGNAKHQAFQRLDRSINTVYKRSYLTFGFLPDDMWPADMLAVAGVTGINMRAGIAPETVGDLALHELGHVFDKHLLTAATRFEFMLIAGIDPEVNTWNRNVQETFADAGREWCKGGWQWLTPILLPEVVV